MKNLTTFLIVLAVSALAPSLLQADICAGLNKAKCSLESSLGSEVSSNPGYLKIVEQLDANECVTESCQVGF